MLQQRMTYVALAVALAAGIAACDSSWARHESPIASDDDPVGNEEQPKDIGKPLYEPKNPTSEQKGQAKPEGVAVDPVVIPCHLTVIDKEEVPSLRDGAINFIGTDLKPGEWETLPPELRVEVVIDGKPRRYRQLRFGDFVEKDQLMAMLDDRLARADKGVKDAGVAVANAELRAAEKTTDEALARFNTQSRLWHSDRGPVTSEEDLRGAKLLWQKSSYDAVSKKAAVNKAELEAKSAQTVLELHEIRASIPGVIRLIYKYPGESVKANEQVFQIQDLTRLRAEGHADVQQIPKLKDPAKVVVEPSLRDNPQQTLIGHFKEITGVAVTKDSRSPVSCSEDGTVRVWDRNIRQERKIWRHAKQIAFRAIACTTPAASANLCLAGAADGSGRIWDLDSDADEPRLLSDQHHGPITCVAFSPDGETCATGGEDQQIRLWETKTGKLRYRFPTGHHGVVTSVQFTPEAQLVSAGRDNTVRLWALGENAAKQEAFFGPRLGEVVNPGVSPDGHTILFDHGRELRLLNLPDGKARGIVFNPGGSSNFSVFALFSPDGHLIVTAGAEEGQLQLWRAPCPATSNRGYEVRQLLFYQKSTVPTCASFSPDGKLLVTGSKDQLVQVWSVPEQKEIEQELPGRLALVEKVVESTAGQVRVWADVPNPGERILAGGAATLTIYPKPPGTLNGSTSTR
jgi:WD40 repeat protein